MQTMLHVLYSIGVLSSPTYFTFASLSFDREIHRLFCVIGVFCRPPHQNSKEMNKLILNKISWKQKKLKLQIKHFLGPSRISLLEFPAALLLLPWMQVSGAGQLLDVRFGSTVMQTHNMKAWKMLCFFSKASFSSFMFAGKHLILHICGN